MRSAEKNRDRSEPSDHDSSSTSHASEGVDSPQVKGRASAETLEIYELVRKPTVVKAVGISVNVAIVGYLAWRLRERVHASKAHA